MDDKTTVQPDVLPEIDYERCASAATPVIYPVIATHMEKPSQPEVPSYLVTVSDMIASFAEGHISYEEYREKLGAWWEQHKGAWQEHDLQRLFLLACFS